MEVGAHRRWAGRVAAMLQGALRRTGAHILVFLLLHLGAVLLGAVMVHRGNTFALARRDAIVGQATTNDPITRAYAAGNRWRAAFLDARGNLFLGAVPLTITGPVIIVPYPLAAYRGWLGGIGPGACPPRRR